MFWTGRCWNLSGRTVWQETVLVNNMLKDWLMDWISFLLSCVLYSTNWKPSRSSCQLLKSVSVSRLQSGTVTEPSWVSSSFN